MIHYRLTSESLASENTGSSPVTRGCGVGNPPAPAEADAGESIEAGQPTLRLAAGRPFWPRPICLARTERAWA